MFRGGWCSWWMMFLVGMAGAAGTSIAAPAMPTMAGAKIDLPPGYELAESIGKDNRKRRYILGKSEGPKSKRIQISRKQQLETLHKQGRHLELNSSHLLVIQQKEGEAHRVFDSQHNTIMVGAVH